MKGIPQGRYTREFRQEAVKLIIEENLSFPEAGRRLSLAPSTLSYWVKAYRAGKLGEIGRGANSFSSVKQRPMVSNGICSGLLLEGQTNTTFSNIYYDAIRALDIFNAEI